MNREKETCCLARSYLSRIYRGELAPASQKCDRLLWLQRALPSATLDKIPTTKLSSSILGEPRKKSNWFLHVIVVFFLKLSPFRGRIIRTSYASPFEELSCESVLS